LSDLIIGVSKPFNNSSRRRLPDKVNLKMVNLVVAFVEEFWHAQKRFPSDSELLTKFNFGGVVAADAGGPEELELLQKLKLTKQFRLACKSRGITYNPFDPAGGSDFSVLEPEQIAAISILTNFADTRPQNLKLSAIGVTPEQIQGWMVNPRFNRELASRADEQLNNIYPEAVTSLNRRVKNGNVAAIKFYFELTGRAVTPEVINLKLAMQHLIEAVQKHVRDPDVLAAIASDFRQVQQITDSAQDPKAGVG
jgi:hypothetical protein